MIRKTEPPNLVFEQALWQSGLARVAGLDEAGRGAMAGPVAVAAVILPPDTHLAQALAGVRDSKQMMPEQREVWAVRIQSAAMAWHVEFASSEEIDAAGIVCAARLAATRALNAIPLLPDYLLTDFRLEVIDSEIPQTSLVKGDQKSLSIAAASVLAKTARDALMRDLDTQYPGYGLARHKGYGTQAHRLAMQRLGSSPVHRKSFSFKEI